MIFVTVGATLGFDRLLKMVDEKIKDNSIIYQIANSSYIPRKGKVHRFLTMDKMENYIQESECVISHAGVGTILQLIKFQKKALIIPRYNKYYEAVDDHQLEIAKYVEKYFNICYDSDEIRLDLLKQFPVYEKDKGLLFSELDKYIEEQING